MRYRLSSTYGLKVSTGNTQLENDARVQPTYFGLSASLDDQTAKPKHDSLSEGFS